MKRTKKVKVQYQIAFSNCEGVNPQKYEIYDTEEEAKKIAESYNKSQGLGKYGNPWAEYVVIERK